MRYYVIAGEASGDLHASNLVSELKKQDPAAVCRGLGGDHMRDAGVELLRHYSETAYMGFAEVVLHLKKILQSIDQCKQDILEWKPDVVVLVDYPGFNLRIAPFAKKNGMKVFYYISPQLWAWKSSRVEIIRRYVDHMFVILPFETEFYRQHNYNADYVGHPLLDAISKQSISAEWRQTYSLQEKEIVAVLPGSRRQEIAIQLPVMLKMAHYFAKYHFVVACAPGVEKSFYNQFVQGENISYVTGQTYAILQNSTAALVTSGTATLETALFKVPEVVCYKGSAISYFIARQLVKVKYISLVNLIMNEPLVTELVQYDFNESKLKSELEKLLFDNENRERIKKGYEQLYEKLGGVGASARAASLILRYLQPTS